jgi:DNA-binding transcriptional MerR regulator
MNARDYLSIGEVLALVQDEFPDTTISKIRFLESQGLIEPERTPSGYRKFSHGDIERLRFILREQKERFLPLKVIKDRLEGDLDDVADLRPAGDPPAAAGLSATSPPAPVEVPAHLQAQSHAEAPAPAPATPSAPTAGAAPVAVVAEVPAPPLPAEPERLPAWMTAPRRAPRRREDAADLDASPLPAHGTGPHATPEHAAATVSAPVVSAAPAAPPAILATAQTGVSFTFEELASATGLTTEQLTEVERYGLIKGTPVGRLTYYEEEAFIVASLAARFLRHGVEPRHLKAYRNAAEREAGLFEQVVLPLVKQRNPVARAQARTTLEELARLGADLRAAMLRDQLRTYTDGR